MMRNWILILCLCLPSLIWADELESSNAAKAWLKLVDMGKYAESWKKAAPFFKAQLTQNKWSNALNKIRTPLGKVTARMELTMKEYSSLPSLPKGNYLVLQFQTSFQNKKLSTETLTLSKIDGQWLPVGYFIR